MSTSFPFRRPRAFSLIELLIVVALIGVIAGFAVPAVQSSLRGSALQQAGVILEDTMSAARQHALTFNTMVEARFYRFGDSEIPGEQATDPTTGQYRAVQYFERGAGGLWMPVSKVLRFPDSAMMSQGERLSTILGEDPATRKMSMDQVKADPANHVELPRGVGMNYEYVFFHFLPSGGTDLAPSGTTGRNSDGGRWHITIHAISDLPKTNPPNYDQAPPNYVCWSVDPVSGTGKVYKPGVR
jgi:uncharacterized protein (TIGR02596 family)